MGGDGPRATPTWHDGRLYVLGATGEFRALDAATGRTLWRTDILADAGAGNIDYGMSASPLVVDNTVVVLPGGSERSISRGVRPPIRQTRVERARRSRLVLVADARHAGGCQADSHLHGDAAGRSLA